MRLVVDSDVFVSALDPKDIFPYVVVCLKKYLKISLRCIHLLLCLLR